METYFYISYFEINRNGDWEMVETDAYSIILHTNRHDGLRLIQLVRDGFNDWVDLNKIRDFKTELRI